MERASTWDRLIWAGSPSPRSKSSESWSATASAWLLIFRRCSKFTGTWDRREPRCRRNGPIYSSPYNSENPNAVMLNSAKSEVYFLKGETISPVMLNNADSKLYFVSSPPELNPEGRERDLQTILDLIDQADHFIYLSVKDFIPAILHNNRGYFPDLDVALRRAAYRGVTVKMLVSKGEHSPKQEQGFLESLAKITPAVKGSVEIKWFTIPATAKQQKIGHARVSHNNYMVTENAGYIGTSNWVGDYFLKSAGVGIVVSSKDSQSIQEQLQAVFDRDWNSAYASPLI